MPNSGDVVRLDLSVPQGREAGFPRPAVVVTSSAVLRHQPTVVQVVPLTSTIRDYDAEVLIEADDGNGLGNDSAAQCQHVRSIAVSRLSPAIGTVSSVQLRQIRETLGLLLDL
ncbi:type II toxin-antitoxin system PemK/MazF family toxin [Nocardioides sp.]|uniref:type II toxin-antitoxin system PemK/MazF family toxin n=1 Tax=Nocardioides sp. TaxID=35761 RepID=UPI00286CE408|nr:type II toxin-antitoxin system PemK/MazF family toxin [Nocardioides sp.]